MIHLDHAATSPLLPEVQDAMRPWLGVPCNPSSVHRSGRAAAAALDRARAEVAALLDRDPAGIVFLSGATEANHTGIRGLAARGARQFAAAAIEHPSVHGALAATGLPLHELPTGPDGIVQLVLPDAVDALLLMAANHETGVLQPVREAAARMRARGGSLHVDATQALGKIDLHGLDADVITASAHKLGGPVGTGVLSLRDGAPFPALMGGGSQERGRRAGTVNVPGAVGFGAACRLAAAEQHERRARQEAATAVLVAGLAGLGARILGGPRLASTTCVVFPGLRGDTIVAALDLEGIAVSSGAACASGSVAPSPVLAAMGEPEASGGVRVSFGPHTTTAEVEALLAALSRVLPTVRAAAVWE